MSLLTRKATVIRKPRGRDRRKSSGPRLSIQLISETGTVGNRLSVPAAHDRDNPFNSRQSGSFSGSSQTSTTSLTLDDEQSLCRSSSYLSESSRYDNPSYGSVLSQIQETSTDSVGLYDFMSNTLHILWSNILCTVFLLVLLGLPVSMIGTGTAYRNDCPKEPKIPIYLLVGGCFGFLKNLLMLWEQKRDRDYDRFDKDDDDDDNEDAVMLRSTRFTGFILNLFLITWFVLGNIWLFRIWTPNFQQPLHEPNNWCSQVVFRFTFYHILICYGLIGLGFVILLGFVIYFFVKRHSRSQQK